MSMNRYALAVAALLVLVPWQRTVRAEPPRYVVQNLGGFGLGVPTVVGINTSGQVVANGTDASGNGVVVRYSDGSGWQTLSGLIGFQVATGINASGAISGYRFADGKL